MKKGLLRNKVADGVSVHHLFTDFKKVGGQNMKKKFDQFTAESRGGLAIDNGM